MQTHEWEALLDGLEGATLAAGHETFPAFDDDDDQSPVSMPCVRVNGMATWSTIGAPSNLVPVLAASIDAVAEVVRLRKAIAAVRDEYQRSAEVDSLLAQFSTVPLIPVFNDLADALTRILERDTDE